MKLFYISTSSAQAAMAAGYAAKLVAGGWECAYEWWKHPKLESGDDACLAIETDKAAIRRVAAAMGVMWVLVPPTLSEGMATEITHAAAIGARVVMSGSHESFNPNRVTLFQAFNAPPYRVRAFDARDAHENALTAILSYQPSAWLP